MFLLKYIFWQIKLQVGNIYYMYITHYMSIL